MMSENWMKYKRSPVRFNAICSWMGLISMIETNLGKLAYILCASLVPAMEKVTLYHSAVALVTEPCERIWLCFVTKIASRNKDDNGECVNHLNGEQYISHRNYKRDKKNALRKFPPINWFHKEIAILLFSIVHRRCKVSYTERPSDCTVQCTGEFGQHIRLP